MPKMDAGMNRVPTTGKDKGGKGSKDDFKDISLGKSSDKAARDAKILDRARRRFDNCVSSESENRKEALQDRKFQAGEQWPADIAAQRNWDKRPCLTVNKIPTFVRQVTNEQRINRPTINVSPVGDRSDPEVAKMYRGLIRYLERESHADIAYDTAFEQSASMGWGFWRTLTEFDAPDSMDQTIVIKRVKNAFTIYLDPSINEPDGSDARYGFITEMIPRHEFEEQYPDADPMSWTEAGAGDTFKNWVEQSRVRIAEYFEIDHEMRTLVALSNGHLGWKDELDPAILADISAGRLEIMRERESEVPAVKWYKLTAVQVLEERDWPGRWIPITRVIGDEIDIEGKTKLSGVVRYARDPQRMYNYAATMEVETVALAPKAPFVGAEGQFEGHEDKWLRSNTTSFPYLEYKPTTISGQPVPPPQRQPASAPAIGWQSLKQGAAQDMMATTGIRFDATLQERVVDESGRALRELRRSSDMGSYHYMDNLCRSLKHQGDIFIDLIPKVIDTKRMITILREDDTEEQVQIDPSAQKAYQETRNPQTGKVLKIFNPKFGKYGVTVTIGPSFATKRIEASESMMDFVRALPQTAQYVADLVAKNQDWPEAEQIAARLAKMLPPQLLQPDMKDVTPQVQAMLQGMDGQIKDLTKKLAIASRGLADKEADRALDQRKIDQDFEAKLLAVVQKAEASFNTHIGTQIKELGANVAMLMKAMGSGKIEDAAGAALAGMQPQAPAAGMNGQAAPDAIPGQGVQ